MKKTKKRKGSIQFIKIGSFLLLLLAVIFSTSSGYAGTWMEAYRYPREYRAHVEQYSFLYGVEPNLIYAIIKAERTGATKITLSNLSSTPPCAKNSVP